MLLTSKLDVGAVERLVMGVSGDLYGHNITCALRDDGTRRDGRHKVRFTLGTRDSFAYGSRRAASGRHMPKASWQAHRDVMRAIYAADPSAVLVTALATYNGRSDFESRFEATGNTEVGSRMAPALIRDLEV